MLPWQLYHTAHSQSRPATYLCWDRAVPGFLTTHMIGFFLRVPSLLSGKTSTCDYSDLIGPSHTPTRHVTHHSIVVQASPHCPHNTHTPCILLWAYSVLAQGVWPVPMIGIVHTLPHLVSWTTVYTHLLRTHFRKHLYTNSRIFWPLYTSLIHCTCTT